MTHRSLSAALIIVLAFVSRAHAAIEYLTQSRSVQAETTFGQLTGNGPRIVSPDFSNFTASVSIPLTEYDARASASHTSSLLPDGISLRMLASGTDGRQSAFGVGQALLDVTFRVTTPSTLLLDWSYDLGPQHAFSSGGSQFTHARVRLSHGFDTLDYEFSHRPVDGYRTTGQVLASSNRVYPIYTYRLTVELTAGMYFFGTTAGSHFGDAQLRLTIPSPATSGVLLTLGLFLARRNRCRPH